MKIHFQVTADGWREADLKIKGDKEEMKLKKSITVLAAAGVLTAMTVTGCGSKLNSDETVATVGDEKITLGVANFYARFQQGQYETYYASMMGTTGEDMWTQEVSDGKTFESQTKKTLLENLENMYLLSQHASDYDVELTDDEKASIKDAAETFVSDNTDKAKDAVSGTEENVEKVLELMTIQTKMSTAMKEGVDENVSDDEAAQKAMQYVIFSYTTTDDSGNSTTITDDEKADLKKKAQDVLDKVKAGGDFEKLAEDAGVTVLTATFDSESTSPDADLIAAADKLEKAGDVTDLVETDNGIYIGKLTSLLDRDATDSKKTSIVEERKQDQYDSLLKEWKDDTTIDVNKGVWKKVNFEKQGVTIKTSSSDSAE